MCQRMGGQHSCFLRDWGNIISGQLEEERKYSTCLKNRSSVSSPRKTLTSYGKYLIFNTFYVVLRTSCGPKNLFNLDSTLRQKLLLIKRCSTPVKSKKKKKISPPPLSLVLPFKRSIFMTL